MDELRPGTAVHGTDKPIGRLTAVVCDPLTDVVTHLVVNADDVLGSERVVPSISSMAVTHPGSRSPSPVTASSV